MAHVQDERCFSDWPGSLRRRSHWIWPEERPHHQGRDPRGAAGEDGHPRRAADLAAADPDPHRHAPDRLPGHDGRQDLRLRPARDRAHRPADRADPQARCPAPPTSSPTASSASPTSSIEIDREPHRPLRRQHPRRAGRHRDRHRRREPDDIGRGPRALPDPRPLSRELRERLDDLERILVPTSTGAHVPIAQVAKIRYTLGPQELKSENGLLVGYVTLNTRDRDEVSVVEDAERAAPGQARSTRRAGSRTLAPPGYYWEWSGQFENQQRAMERLRPGPVPLVLHHVRDALPGLRPLVAGARRLLRHPRSRPPAASSCWRSGGRT